MDTENKGAEQNKANSEDAQKQEALDFIEKAVKGEKEEPKAEPKAEPEPPKDNKGDDNIPPEPQPRKDNAGGDDDSAANKVDDTEKEKGKQQPQTNSIDNLFDEIDLKAIEDDEAMDAKDLVSFISGVKNLRDAMVEMRKELKAQSDFIRAVQAERAETEFDEIFEDLSEEFGDVLGKGKLRTLDKVMQDNRNAVLKKAAVLMKAYSESGESKSNKELIKEAALLMYNEKARKDKPREQKQDRQNAFIAKPNAPSENGDMASSGERDDAISFIRGFMNKH